MAEIRIGVSGCGGRMGRMVALEAIETRGCRLSGGIEAEGSRYLGIRAVLKLKHFQGSALAIR